MQVIVYTNQNGGVNVCYPTGEISIEEVQAKDTPAGSVIIDESELPQGDNAIFMGAWVLTENVITVDIEKAKTYKAVVDYMTKPLNLQSLSKIFQS
jgi:hypothetical protein